MIPRIAAAVRRQVVGRWKLFFAGGVALGLVLGLVWRGHDRTACRQEHLASLTPAHIDRVRLEPSSVREAYAECREELQADLGKPFDSLTEADRQLVFCMVMAYSLAPYGKSDAILLPDLLKSPKLHCGNYPVLMAELQRFFPADDSPPVSLVGWTYGPHGMACRPHADESRCLFLDPTVAMVVRGKFDDVAAGRPIQRRHLVSFAHRDETAAARDHMAATFTEGRYRPSHLLYYYENLDQYTHRRGNARDWPTPGAAGQRTAGDP